ncbi:MAG TPA: hypothetical protein VFC24_03380, partial [Casimicrobiaceae bacterium]|nr:hypothetical protein [Casimicrobiaceae bacterium]
TGPAWSYPTTLAWMQVWFASAAGGWIEPLVNLPWVAVWVALLCAHYGQWRALGLSRAKALAFVYVLGSLPLPTVHVALAGYADLWLATMLGLGVLAWLRWIEQGDRAQLAIALACAFALPLIKLEGAVWLLLFAMVAGYSALPRRRRRLTVGIVAAVLLAMLVVGKLILPLFGLGWVNVHLHSIEVPVLGNLPIGWHAGAFGSIAQSLFAQANWNLLWWIVPAVVVWRWRELRLYAATRALGALLCAGLGFLVFLFAFTDAAQWAESYTAINRLVMHLVPATVTLLALLSRNLDLQALLGRERASAPRSAPA